jgi:hypothetical protein
MPRQAKVLPTLRETFYAPSQITAVIWAVGMAYREILMRRQVTIVQIQSRRVLMQILILAIRFNVS